MMKKTQTSLGSSRVLSGGGGGGGSAGGGGGGGGGGSKTPTASAAGGGGGAKGWVAVRDVGIAEDANREHRQSMEDTHYVEDCCLGEKESAFFAVYDGHGGVEAAKIAQEMLHLKFFEELKRGSSVEQAWLYSYKETHLRLSLEGMMFSGAAAVCAFVRAHGGHRFLYTANAGDARAVVSRDGRAQRLTYDHKASDEGEQKRVVLEGGKIMLGRVGAVLAISRALGDHGMQGVSAVPYTHQIQLSKTDDLLVVACDGVWDVFSDQQVIDLLTPLKTTVSAQRAAEILVQQALEAGTGDNLTAIVIYL